MPVERIAINHEILRWARLRAHYSIAELSEKVNKNYESWETGDSLPTYLQLEAISRKFKVPIAIFFFPEPPDIEPIHHSFRTLPEDQFNEFPREIHSMLRKGKSFQISLSELNDGRNPSKQFIIDDLHFKLNVDISHMAKAVRDFLDVSLEEQKAWPDVDTAFDNWRTAIQNCGVAVFKDAFKNDSYFGFCLYDPVFPVIYINNSSAKSRQIFTLFHELAHLCFKTSGVDVTDEFIFEDRVEVICNKFASEFLLPDEQFENELRGKDIKEKTVENISERYCVSREVVYRRFLDRNLITADDYKQTTARWTQQYYENKNRNKENIQGDYYWNTIAYLGMEYVRLAFSKFHQNRITEMELSDHLNVKVRNLDKLEDHYLQKMD